jgi:hypothetical protein
VEVVFHLEALVHQECVVQHREFVARHMQLTHLCRE